MKHKSTILALFVILFLSAQTPATAQNEEPENNRPWSVGLNIGGSLYQGDFYQDNFFWISSENEVRPSFDINVTRSFGYLFEAQAQFVLGNLCGVYVNGHKYFESKYTEFNIQGMLNVSNLFGNKRNDRLVTLLFPVGIGFINYNSTLYEYDRKTEIDSGTGTLPALLLGGRAHIYVSPRWYIQMSSISRITFSDQLDTFERNKNDVYNYSSIGFGYRF